MALLMRTVFNGFLRELLTRGSLDGLDGIKASLWLLLYG